MSKVVDKKPFGCDKKLFDQENELVYYMFNTVFVLLRYDVSCFSLPQTLSHGRPYPSADAPSRQHPVDVAEDARDDHGGRGLAGERERAAA